MPCMYLLLGGASAASFCFLFFFVVVVVVVVVVVSLSTIERTNEHERKNKRTNERTNERNVNAVNLLPTPTAHDEYMNTYPYLVLPLFWYLAPNLRPTNISDTHIPIHG